MKRLITALLVVSLLFSLCACTTIENQSSLDYFPTEGWKYSTPESQGMDSEKLAEAVEFLYQSELNIHSLVIVRNGYIVTEAYFAPYKSGQPHDVASVSKSITSTLMGIAIDKGYIDSANQTLGEYLDSIDENKKNITIHNLLTMQTGFEISSVHMIDLYNMIASKKWLEYINNIGVDEEAVGNEFEYNNFAPYLNSLILREATGQDTQQFADEYLLEPLGISDYSLPTDPDDYAIRAYGDMAFTPTDLAKIGLLYLNDGQWDGKQIVSSEWAEKATSQIVEIGKETRSYTVGYGYYFWIDEQGHYSARGRGNQRLDVFPDENLIVVVNSSSKGQLTSIYKEMNTLFNDCILSSIVSDDEIDENEAEYNNLQETIEKVQSCEMKNQDIQVDQNLNESYLDTTYILDTNLLDLKSVIISKEDDKTYLVEIISGTVEKPDKMTIRLNIEGDKLYYEGRNNIQGISYIKSMGENNVEFHINELGNIDLWNISIQFTDNRISVAFTDLLGHGKDMVLLGTPEE